MQPLIAQPYPRQPAVPWEASFPEHGLACIYIYVVSFRVSCLRVTSVVRLSDVVSVVRWGGTLLGVLFLLYQVNTAVRVSEKKNLLKCPPQVSCSLWKASERASQGPHTSCYSWQC